MSFSLPDPADPLHAAVNLVRDCDPDPAVFGDAVLFIDTNAWGREAAVKGLHALKALVVVGLDIALSLRVIATQAENLARPR